MPSTCKPLKIDWLSLSTDRLDWPPSDPDWIPLRISSDYQGHPTKIKVTKIDHAADKTTMLRCRTNTVRCPCEPAFSKQMSLAFAMTDLCSQPAPSTPMRVPRGRSLSEPSRHTCLMTLDESPLMPILERLRWRQGWRCSAINLRSRGVRADGQQGTGASEAHGVRAGTAHEPRGAPKRSAGLGRPSTNLGARPLSVRS